MKTLKVLIATSVLILSQISAAASSSPQSLNNQALAILIQNASKLTSEEGKPVSSLLAESMLTSADTHNKISNNCIYDSNDSAFKCSLTISNADDKVEGRTESSTEIQYQLERDASGQPSKEMFYLTVQIQRAG